MFQRTLFTILASALLITSQSQAALMIDFGETGAPAGELEPGFSAFQVTNATSYQGTFFDYAGTGLDNGTPLRVTIDGTATAAGAQRLLDRGTAGWTGGQDALLRDWIGIDARSTTAGNGTDTIVRIANLQPGFYKIKSYHTDISAGNQSPQLDYLVNGQLLVDNFQVKGQAAAGGNSTAVPNFFEAVLPAEAATPVAMTYRVPTTAAGDKGFAALNGFELVKLSETPVVAVDFNDRANAGAAHTQAGFSEFLLAGADLTLQTTTTRSFGPINVTLNMPTGTMDDRPRTEPTNSGAFTEQLLLRDFVFASDIAGAETMEIVVEGVRPNTLHGITIWSFDDSSPAPARVTDWTVNGVLAFDNYSFDGNAVPPAPANNDIYSFSFTGTSDALGRLVLRGIGQNTTAPQVFLNALRVVDLEAPTIPEPATAALGLIALAALARRRRSV